MVHACLMYGFPTETTQETVDSLEVVRQLFGEGVRIFLYNYMNATGFDLLLQKWFDFKIPTTTVPRGFIRQLLKKC